MVGARRPLLALPVKDARLIAKELAPLARPVEKTIDDYLDWVARVTTAS